jgi:hypothetical protein
MVSAAKSVLKAALQLPPRSRAALAEKLVKSLRENASKDEGEIEMTQGLRLAIEQAENDWQAYKQGEIGGRPADEVFRSIRSKAKKR